jgi:hypothetical protein
MICHGLVDEGLAIVKGVADRYDGLRRNPWNEVECGSHYARALASWSVLMALSGYRYSAIDQQLGFAPVINAGDFRCFFAAGPAWGVYSQRLENSAQAIRLEVVHGELPLRLLNLKHGLGSEKILVANLHVAGNEAIRGHKLNVSGANVQLDLGQPVMVPSGAAVSFHLKPA